MTPSLRTVFGPALIVLLLSSHTTPMGAQQVGKTVVVAVTDELPGVDTRALVVRYTDTSKDDLVILSRRFLSTNVLAAAFVTLERQREAGAAAPSESAVPLPRHDAQYTRIESAEIYRGSRPPEMEATLRNVLERVLKEPTVQIGNLGPGKWIRLTNMRSGT